MPDLDELRDRLRKLVDDAPIGKTALVRVLASEIKHARERGCTFGQIAGYLEPWFEHEIDGKTLATLYRRVRIEQERAEKSAKADMRLSELRRSVAKTNERVSGFVHKTKEVRELI